MSNQMNTANQELSQEDAELAALLADFDNEEPEYDEASEIIAADCDDEDLQSIVGEVELSEARADAYNEQDEDAAKKARLNQAAEPSSEVDTSTDAGADQKASSKTKKTASPRVNTSGMKPSAVLVAKFAGDIYDVFVLNTNDADLDSSNLRSAIDDRLIGLDALPKKIGEKAVNMLMSIGKGVNLSTYTRTAVQLLAEKGSITTADIKAAYLAHPYSDGTANAQSSQMMKLLPFMGIATRSGSTLVLDGNSVLIHALTQSSESADEEETVPEAA